jgi:hypothetical protein
MSKPLPADVVLLEVAAIDRLRRNGATWRQIAPAIGTTSPQAAKAKAKKLAREANRALLQQGVTRG